MDGSINMLTPGNRDILNNFASGGQMAGKGMIGLAIIDANGMPVAGATVSSTPASGAGALHRIERLSEWQRDLDLGGRRGVSVQRARERDDHGDQGGDDVPCPRGEGAPDKFTTTSISP